MDQVNLKRLAQELNLSISTISRALRDSYEISAETKAKVTALARKLNYQPNPYASSLRKQQSKTIAVVIPEIANNFFALAINGIETIARQKGYHVLIYLTHEDFEKEVSISRHLINGRVDGILMSVSSQTNNTAHIEELIEKKIPVVFFDRACESINTAKISTDDYKISYQATEHLIRQGAKKIAYLSISQNLSIGKNRRQGYSDALNDYGLDANLIVNCSHNNDDNYKVIRHHLSSENRPDALFASIERLAITGYYVCNELELNIPTDVKIISFSNLETAPLLNPSLTCIVQPAFNIGKAAAEVLFKALEKPATELFSESLVIASQLIEGRSTAKG